MRANARWRARGIRAAERERRGDKGKIAFQTYGTTFPHRTTNPTHRGPCTTYYSRIHRTARGVTAVYPRVWNLAEREAAQD